MVCSRCTLLHPEYAIVCGHCGTPLRSAAQRISTQLVVKAPLGIGVMSGLSLLSCLFVALVLPTVAAQALAAGAYFGIISITNIWWAVYRDMNGEWLRGMRGLSYSAALLVSLVAELARMQHLDALALPGIPGGVPVPSALATEMLAAILIVLDPLVVTPLVRWIEAGVERSEPEA